MNPTDKSPQETLRVTKWSDEPPPTRYIDLPGLSDDGDVDAPPMLQMDQDGSYKPARPQKRVPDRLLRPQGSRSSLERSNSNSSGMSKRRDGALLSGPLSGKSIRIRKPKGKMARSLLGR